MRSTPILCFQPVDSCLDYQSYSCALDPELPVSAFAEVRQLLRQLGTADQERMGVVYVRGPWGFFVIPGHGYPSLRASFFFDTPDDEIEKVLGEICAVLAALNVSEIEQGESNE